MRVFLCAIIALLPTYVVRFHIGSLPTTLLEILLLFLFIVWGTRRITLPLLSLRSRGDLGRLRRGNPPTAPSAAARLVGLPSPSAPTDASRSLRYEARHVYRDMLTNLIPNTLRIPVALFLLASIIAVVVAPDRIAALGLWRAYILEPILFFVVFLDLARGWTTMWRDVTIALSVSVLCVSFVALWQWFDPAGPLGFFPIPNPTWIPEDVRRVTSVYGFPNAVGLYLAPIVVFLIGHARSLPKRLAPRAALIAVAAVGTVSIAAARSDGAIMALIAGLFTVGFLNKKTRTATIGFAALTMIVLAFSSLRSPIIEKITLQEPSGRVRIEQWYGTIAMLRDRPILGAGLAAYPTVFSPYNRQPHIEVFQYPHNIVLNFWSEMGLLGLLAFGWIVFVLFHQLLIRCHFDRGAERRVPACRPGKERSLDFARDDTIAAPILIAVMLTLLIHGLVDVPYFKNDLAIFFWLMMAVALTPQRHVSS